MTATLTPRRDPNAFRGFFLVFILFNLHMPQFSLGFNTVTMTVNWFDVVHASVSNGGSFGKFTSFLLLPGWACTAAGHYTGNAIADTFQIFTSTSTFLEVISFFIQIVYVHYIFCLVHCYLNRALIFLPDQGSGYMIRKQIRSQSKSLKLFRKWNSSLRKEEPRKSTHGRIPLKRSTVMPLIALCENLWRSKNMSTADNLKRQNLILSYTQLSKIQLVVWSLSVEKRRSHLGCYRCKAQDI